MSRMKKLLSILISVVLLSGMAGAESKADESIQTYSFWNWLDDKNASRPEISDEELKKRVLITGLASGAAIMAWGAAFWDYSFDTSKIANEGWFGKDTKYGGADKMGHVYSTYLWSLGFSSLYEYWGVNEEDAMLYGPLSSWFFQFMMEIGDSSAGDDMGFSYEDVVMNTVGAAFYYFREKYPAVKEKLDLRIEYIPEFGNKSFFTQYNSMKYLVAMKFSGFESMDSNLLKYGELQLGYYTRGYKDPDEYSQKERTAYIGVGINISKVLSDLGWIKTGKVFNYYQLPYTYVPFGYDYDSRSYVQPWSRPYRGYKR